MPKPNRSFRNNPDFYKVLNFPGLSINYMESVISHCAGAAINFFRGPAEVTKAKNIIAKYFEDNSLDIKKIDGKGDSFLFILVRLIKENLLTEEKFKLLEKMDESKEEDQSEEDQFEEEVHLKRI